MRHAGQRFTGFLDGDQDTPEAIAAHEVPGAVNGVDDPAATARAGFVRAFLAQDAVVGKFALDRLTNEALVLTVCDGDGRVVGFGFGGNAAGADLPSIFAGSDRDAAGEFELSMMGRRHIT